ncbi:unnamed protein product [Amoebophrya sp. A25]|nr:unnamed protein product [Amoebophrya sp. A25]|eukprot:GSA25T00019011001.1
MGSSVRRSTLFLLSLLCWLGGPCCVFSESLDAAIHSEPSLRTTNNNYNLVASRNSSDHAFAVFGYLPEWRFAGSHFGVQVRHYTHLIFFSLEIDPNTGRIAAADRLTQLQSALYYAKEARSIQDSQAINPPGDAGQKTRTQFLVCFGGNGRSAGFSAMVRDKKKRKRFVKELTTKLIFDVDNAFGGGFDGVDYNWEYPGYDFRRGYLPDAEVRKDYEGLGRLLKDTRKMFDKKTKAEDFESSRSRRVLPDNVVSTDATKDSTSSSTARDQARKDDSTTSTTSERQARKTISLAYYPDGKQEQLFAAHKMILQYTDYFHSMAYDQHGRQHSPFSLAEKTIEYAEKYLGPEVLPKVTLGLPFYGRRENTGEWMSYEDILTKQWEKQKGKGITAKGDVQKSQKKLVEKTRALDTLEEDKVVYGYNGPRMIERKVKLAWEKGLGGVMVWEAGQDCRAELLEKKSGAKIEKHVATCDHLSSTEKSEAAFSLSYAITKELGNLGMTNDTKRGDIDDGRTHEEL